MKVENISETWAETGAIILLLMGFVASLLLKYALIIYLIILLSGFLAGRILYIKRFKEPIFPFVLMIIGFLFGYVLGTFWASRFWTTIFFIIGFAASYYLHMKKILVSFKSEDFLK